MTQVKFDSATATQYAGAAAPGSIPAGRFICMNFVSLRTTPRVLGAPVSDPTRCRRLPGSHRIGVWRSHSRTICLLLAVTALTAAAADAELYELPPFNYSKATPRDATARLQARLAKNEIQFTGSDREVLEALLREYGIPRESQVVVFSKTSLQRTRIRPDHPRALYFTDDAYVGWVPGGLMEVTTIDPVLGPIFYALDPATIRTNAAQSFTRDNDCLRCHGGAFARGIPGVFVRSLFTDADGEPLLRHGSEVVDFRTPFTNRWGGWYVTGQHGTALHRGNVFAREKNDQLDVDLRRGANITNLAGFFDTTDYPAPGSDIVALLVLEHQVAMQNTLTRASLNCRRMLDYQKNLQRELKETVTDELVYGSVKSVFDGAAREIVDDLLFYGEAELPAGVQGDPAFQRAFQRHARRAADGSSLKDFSLQGRIFQNRCSYLIYSDSFRQLPAQLKQRVFARLARALKPAESDPRYAYLGTEERSRIVVILRETHPELREALRQMAAAN